MKTGINLYSNKNTRKSFSSSTSCCLSPEQLPQVVGWMRRKKNRRTKMAATHTTLLPAAPFLKVLFKEKRLFFLFFKLIFFFHFYLCAILVREKRHRCCFSLCEECFKNKKHTHTRWTERKYIEHTHTRRNYILREKKTRLATEKQHKIFVVRPATTALRLRLQGTWVSSGLRKKRGRGVFLLNSFLFVSFFFFPFFVFFCLLPLFCWCYRMNSKFLIIDIEFINLFVLKFVKI